MSDAPNREQALERTRKLFVKLFRSELRRRWIGRLYRQVERELKWRLICRECCLNLCLGRLSLQNRFILAFTTTRGHAEGVKCVIGGGAGLPFAKENVFGEFYYS